MLKSCAHSYCLQRGADWQVCQNPLGERRKWDLRAMSAGGTSERSTSKVLGLEVDTEVAPLVQRVIYSAIAYFFIRIVIFVLKDVIFLSFAGLPIGSFFLSDNELISIIAVVIGFATCHCVDLGESFPTRIYLQKSASIQPRTNPSKFGGKIQFNIHFTPRSPRTPGQGRHPIRRTRYGSRLAGAQDPGVDGF